MRTIPSLLFLFDRLLIRLLFSMLLSCFSFQFTAQNLVPDPGFEIMQKTPCKEDNSIRCTSNWVNSTVSAGDYYNRASKGRFGGVPKNEFGYQEPHSGEGYAGICIQNNLVEYVESKLTSRLIKEKKYLIEFYICKAENRLGFVTEFGVLFTNKLEYGYDKTGIPQQPPVDFINSNGYKNNKEWTKLSTTYIAKGYESAFIIGHFNYDQPKGFKGKAHYFIDDVTISPVNDGTSTTTTVVKVQIKNSTKTVSPAISETISLKNIFFSTNKSELLSQSSVELDKLVETLKGDPETLIQIDGHTDNSGNEINNKELSELRAKAVTDYLIMKGINKIRITYHGYGSSKPITTNDSDEGKQNNRRVEFTINKK